MIVVYFIHIFIIRPFEIPQDTAAVLENRWQFQLAASRKQESNFNALPTNALRSACHFRPLGPGVVIQLLFIYSSQHCWLSAFCLGKIHIFRERLDYFLVCE